MVRGTPFGFLDMYIAVPGTRGTDLRPGSDKKRSNDISSFLNSSARALLPRVHVITTIYTTMAIRKGNHPPWLIFIMFAPKNATSTIKRPIVTAAAVMICHFHIETEHTYMRSVVMTISVTMAAPYALARLPEERKTRTRNIVPRNISQLTKGMYICPI